MYIVYEYLHKYGDVLTLCLFSVLALGLGDGGTWKNPVKNEQ